MPQEGSPVCCQSGACYAALCVVACCRRVSLGDGTNELAFREIESDAVDAIVEVIALGQARFQQFATKPLLIRNKIQLVEVRI